MPKNKLFPNPVPALLLLGAIAVPLTPLTPLLPSSAQIFNGFPQEDKLPSTVNRGTRSVDTYRLNIPTQKMTRGITKFIISYPESFNGKFDTQKIQILVNREKQPLYSTNWDEANHLLELELEEPIPIQASTEIVLSGVVRPAVKEATQFRFDCRALTVDTPTTEIYIGSWFLTIF